MEAITDAISAAAAEGGEIQAKGEAAGQAIGDMIFNRASAEDTRSPNRGPLYDFRKTIMKAANRPTKRKRDDEEAQNQPTAEPPAKKPNQTKAKATAATKVAAPAAQEEAESSSDIMEEDSEDDDDYSVDADPDQGSWQDHVIMDSDEDDEDDGEPVFLPPSAKRRKLLLNVFVMKALQRMGTSPAVDEDDEDDIGSDEHFYMNDDANREDDDDSSDISEDVPAATVATPAIAAAPTPATPPAAQPKQPGSGRRVVFDMSKVHVQEFDKHESPSTVQSPRPRTGASARPILKASPSRSPMSNSATKNGEKNKMKNVQRKL